MNRRSFVTALAAAPAAFAVVADATEWIPLFDGHSMSGWRPSENKSSWKVVDGMLAADGPRSHLFYNGPVRGADFRNFELEVELMTKPECNSGVYFHTAYQETGFPEKGFEIQVNNTALGDKGYRERKKTGSLYGIRNVYKQLVPDEKPFRYNISVRGKNVQIRLNGELLVDYVEPTPPVIPTGGEKGRFLDHGTFALQCHNDGSRAFYRSVRVRPLPDNLPAYTASAPAPVVDEVYRQVIDIGRHNVPMVDFHVYLTGNMTVEKALRKSRADGIEYGLTTSAGTRRSDAEAERWLQTLAGKPLFYSLEITDRDFEPAISQAVAKRFDCILGDARRFTSSNDGAESMDSLIDLTVKKLQSEPVDIYAYPTALSPGLQAQADQLWTRERRAKLIDALRQNQVAIELNTPRRLPSKQFILEAKAAGCKFAFGSGNANPSELRRCDYGLQMLDECKLEWQDFYTPGTWWPKAAERRWPSKA